MKLHEICTIFDTSSCKSYTPIQLAELRQREFHTDEVWIKWKQDLDACLSYRKSIKGKPTEEQMFFIEENAFTIKFLKTLLFGEGFS